MSTATAEPEVACTLSQEQRAERRKELRAGLIPRIRRVRELADGYAFGLDLTAADEAEARDFAAFECECCSFASYDVQRDEAESAIWLSVRGPAGTKDLFRKLVPESIAIEALHAGDALRDKRLLRSGIAGVGAALLGIAVCASPILALVLGSIGLGAAVAGTGAWVDAVAAPLLLGSLLAIGLALWRRRHRAAPQRG